MKRTMLFSMALLAVGCGSNPANPDGSDGWNNGVGGTGGSSASGQTGVDEARITASGKKCGNDNTDSCESCCAEEIAGAMNANPGDVAFKSRQHYLSLCICTGADAACLSACSNNSNWCNGEDSPPAACQSCVHNQQQIGSSCDAKAEQACQADTMCSGYNACLDTCSKMQMPTQTCTHCGAAYAANWPYFPDDICAESKSLLQTFVNCACAAPEWRCDNACPSACTDAVADDTQDCSECLAANCQPEMDACLADQ